MTDGDALLRAVLANPDEDTPRLVYADWLQEQGEDDRAEFIRVQCELEPLRGFVSGPEWLAHHLRIDRLKGRERELLDANAHVWGFDLPPGFRPLLPDDIRRTYARGFVESVTCAAADWLAHADALLAAHPVRRVRLITVPELHTTPDEGTADFFCGIRGGGCVEWVKNTWNGPPDEMPEAVGRVTLLHLLAAEFPGVAFELPRRVSGPMAGVVGNWTATWTNAAWPADWTA